jgi:hypothetical protein
VQADERRILEVKVERIVDEEDEESDVGDSDLEQGRYAGGNDSDDEEGGDGADDWGPFGGGGGKKEREREGGVTSR